MKPSEIRFLSQASKEHREFIVTKGLLQYELSKKYSILTGMSDSTIPVDIHAAVIARKARVIKLNLSECEDIADVSLLGKVKKLDLTACTGITRGRQYIKYDFR